MEYFGCQKDLLIWGSIILVSGGISLLAVFVSFVADFLKRPKEKLFSEFLGYECGFSQKTSQNIKFINEKTKLLPIFLISELIVVLFLFCVFESFNFGSYPFFKISVFFLSCSMIVSLFLLNKALSEIFHK